MIPVKLKMRNFMPYRGDVPTFSFEGIHIACICGDNGNGKSALIDAITWAIWGKTRAKSDDDLIHNGETNMEVEFDFNVGEQLYRIIRKHSKPKRRKSSGQSNLDLFIADSDGFKVISSDTLKQTQQKIISLLNMDYDTFINSAFLRQGHANEFTKQPPAKRKEVLANILGLSLYDRLGERARELSKQQQMERAQLENAIIEIDQELSQKPELEAALNKAQHELTLLEKEIKEQQSVLNRLMHEKESLQSKNIQLTQLKEHMTKTEEDLNRWQSQLYQHRQRIKDYQELIAKREAIEEGYSQFIQVRKLNEELNQKLQLLNKMKDRKSQLEKTIQKAQSGLLSEHAVAQSKIIQLETSLKRLSQLKEEKWNLDSEQRRMSLLGDELQGRRQLNQKLLGIVHELEISQERLEQDIHDIEYKVDLIQDQSNAKCPLCETEIGQDGLKVIKSKYNDELDGKKASLMMKRTKLADKKVELKQVEKEVQELEAKLEKDRASLQGKESITNQAITEAEAVANKLDEEKNILAEIENRLAIKDFANQEQVAFNKLEEELTSLNYDPSQHQRTSQQLVTLEKYEQPKYKLEEAERLLSWEQKEATKASDAVQELNSRLDTDRQKKQLLASELNALPQLESDLNQAEAEYQTTTEKQKQSQEINGSLKGRLEYLLKQEIKRQAKKNQLEQLTKEDKIYRDLAQAFGKKGIQAMLIEVALPDIETEANKLLGRMTDNRMHVKIETQRQSKKGEAMEILDINISDELGSRPYENYSGGEAFRIDFAIRIALSRLLAKRAGAPLPTLIIDEGFGTQDSTGLEKIKEAINSIQDDFNKIIVITHIEELKDAFPTRINVIKTAAGSTLEVN